MMLIDTLHVLADLLPRGFPLETCEILPQKSHGTVRIKLKVARPDTHRVFIGVAAAESDVENLVTRACNWLEESDDTV